MTDGIITALCYISEAVMLVALLYCRAWRTVPVLFCVQMFEAAEMLLCLWKPYLWHDIYAVNAALDLVLFAVYCARPHWLNILALLSLFDFALIIFMYARIDLNWMLPLDWIYYSEQVVNLAVPISVTLAVYHLRAGRFR